MPLLRALVLAALLALAAVAPAGAIVGGTETQRDWPHMAGMEVLEDGQWRFRCGGSLVRPDVVLSAAHCVDGQEDRPETFRLLLGTRDRESGGERIGVTRIVKHPEWDDGEDSHDVALLKLGRASGGAPIRIAGGADAANFEPGDPATIIGWGATMSGGGAVRTLREATVPIRSDEECASSYTLTASFEPATNICAGNLLGGQDSCQGDSGGPMMVPGADGRFVLVGDTSFGVGCALPTQYGVYGEVAGAVLKPWIEARLNEMSAGPAPGPSGSSPSGAAGSSALPRITLPRSLGSASRARARRRLAVRLRTTSGIRTIRMRLVQRGRTVAAGRRPRLRSRSGRVTLRVRRSPRAGTAVLRVTARDDRGRRVRAARRVRLRG